MTRLEFVSMSLIKGLKGVIYIDGEQEIVTLKSIDTDGNEIWVSNDKWVYSSLNYDIKIICRTLSDLTKEIEHNGEKFVPIEKLGNKFSVGKCSLYPTTLDMNTNETYSINILAYFNIFQKLIEWKFDLFGGIDSGDAIDVNSLHENPYK